MGGGAVERCQIEGDGRAAAAEDLLGAQHVMAKMKLGKLAQLMAVATGIEDIREKHGVVDRLDRNVIAGEHGDRRFDIMADLEERGVLEQRPQAQERLLERELLQGVAGEV